MKHFSETQDHNIVALFWARDENAIKETEIKYKHFLFFICNGILRRKEDSEECVNTVYLKIWESIPPHKPDDFKAFIARIARNTAIDCYRTNYRYKRNAGVIDSLDDYADTLISDDSVDNEINKGNLTVFLNEFLRSLPQRDRVCFMKRYFFNCSVDEIVKQTHIPRSTVYMVLKQVKKELKRKLLEEGYL